MDESLEKTWRVLSEGLIAVLSGSIAKGDVKQVMELLDVAFAYCTSAANTAQAHAKGAAAAGGGGEAGPSSPSVTVGGRRGEKGQAHVGGGELYRRVQMLLDVHVRRVSDTVERCGELHGEGLLVGYGREAGRYAAALLILDKVFKHLNENWVRIHRARPVSLEGLSLWASRVHAPVAQRITAAVCQAYRDMREGKRGGNCKRRGGGTEQVEEEGSEVKATVEIIMAMGEKLQQPCYEALEKMLLEDCYCYYTANAAGKVLGALAVSPAFLDELQAIESLETRLCRLLGVGERTRELLLRVVDQHVLASKLEDMQHAVTLLLQEGRYPQLRTLIHVMRRVEPSSLDKIHGSFEVFVVHKLSQALELVARSARAQPQALHRLYVPLLLDFHHRFSELIERYFEPSFQARFLSAFRLSVNKNQVTALGHSSARLLARYLDTCLRSSPPPPPTPTSPTSSSSPPSSFSSSSGDASPSSLSALVTAAVAHIFPLLEAKDVFLECYLASLATRVIHRLSLSAETEREVVTMLRAQTDDRVMEPIMRLFNDLYESAEFQEGFKRHLQGRRNNKAASLDFNLLLISYGQWPVPLSPYCFATAQYPELHDFEQCLSAYYSQVHPGKKLSMLHHYARGHLHTNFTVQRPHTLICSGTQIAVLLLFNRSRVLSYEQVLASTLLPENDLALAFRSLLTAEVLSSDPPLAPQAPIPPSQAFRLNTNFARPETRIRISDLIPIRSTADRISDQNFIMAAVVRQIKPVRSMTYVQLVEALLRTVKMRISPDTALIDTSLATLVDRKLIHYDLSNHTYSYAPNDQ